MRCKQGQTKDDDIAANNDRLLRFVKNTIVVNDDADAVSICIISLLQKLFTILYIVIHFVRILLMVMMTMMEFLLQSLLPLSLMLLLLLLLLLTTVIELHQYHNTDTCQC